MKKTKAKRGKTIVNKTDVAEEQDPSTFAEWLKSNEGLAYIKLFIIANTIILFLTFSWPQIAETLDGIYYHYIRNNRN